MRNSKKLVALVLTGVLAFGAGVMPKPSTKAAVETVQAATINEKGLSMKIGNQAQLRVEDAVESTKWSSSKKKVASVNGDGVVTALAKGKTVITAKSGKQKYKWKVNVSLYTIETEKLPLYLGNASAERTSEIELAFIDGIKDVPYVSLETMEELIHTWVTYYEDGEKYDITFTPQKNVVLLTRENGASASIDFTGETIDFTDYEEFIRVASFKPLIDVINNTGLDENDQPYLFQFGESYERHGDPLTLYPGKYGIDLVRQGDGYYIPLQTVSDFFLTNYSGNVLFNSKTVCVVAGGGINNFEDKYYISDAPKERSEELIDFNYRELCFALDALYGLKDQHKIRDFDSLFMSTGLIENLMSKDPQVAGQGLCDLICKYLSDGHSGMNTKSYMMADIPKRNWGPTSLQRFDEMEFYKNARAKYYPDGAVPYEEVGNTAYITFDEFIDNEEDYYGEDKPEDNQNGTIGLILYAYQQITRKDSPIENVVLDLSNNGGGEAPAVAFVLGAFLGDGKINIASPMTNAQVTEIFKVDLNLDRKFDDKDSLKDYNLFCLCSPASFSCGNLAPCALKDSHKVTLIGQTTAGGACVVQRLTTADGCFFQLSGKKQISFSKNGSFYDVDRGVEPDYVISNAELLYNREYMTGYVNGLLGK